MAKIKYSALVSDMRNKLNGSVMSKNRFGSYVRNKVTPVNPQTVYQQNSRQRFGALSSSFKELTPAQVTAWNDAANNFPVTNIFGDQVFLSGQMLFNRLNGNLLKIGSPTITAAPEPASFPEFSISGSFADATDQTVGVTFLGLTTIPAGYKLVAYATRPTPVSRSFIKNEYRFIGVVSSVTAGDADISALYTARFGTFEAGRKIGMRFALVSTTNGQQSVPVEVVAVSE